MPGVHAKMNHSSEEIGASVCSNVDLHVNVCGSAQ